MLSSSHEELPSVSIKIDGVLASDLMSSGISSCVLVPLEGSKKLQPVTHKICEMLIPILSTSVQAKQSPSASQTEPALELYPSAGKCSKNPGLNTRARLKYCCQGGHSSGLEE